MLYYITKLARVNSFSKNFSDNFQHAVLYNVRMRVIKKNSKKSKISLDKRSVWCYYKPTILIGNVGDDKNEIL